MEKEIRNNIASFYQPVTMPGGWTHDVVDTLKYNHLYYYGKYATGNTDNLGFYKFFYNITKPTCDIATKFVDLDTKDILLLPEGGGDTNSLYTWFMQRELRQYMKESGFAQLMNQIAEQFPKGHVVLKKTKKGFKKVPLVSMRLDPSRQNLTDGWHGELHLMSLQEVKDAGWDYEQMKNRAQTQGLYHIYEMYIPEGSKWRRIIYGGLHDIANGETISRTSEAKINEGSDYLPPVILANEQVNKSPYFELKWEDVEGRWLGFGYPEYLKDNQISANETENLERKALILKALQLYQTTDEQVEGKNILTDTQNGDILISGDGINPIVKDNADLSAYNNTNVRNNENIERKTFTSDITTGNNLPSRTPLGVANLQASLATSYFELKRENYGLFLKDIIWNEIIPDFKNKTAKAHALDFIRSDEDRKKVEELVIDLKEWEFRKNYIEKTSFKPTLEELDRAIADAKDQIQKMENVSVKIPARAYNDVKNRLDITVTGENIDVSARSSVLQTAMQIAGTNPAVFQTEPMRTILLKFLALGGYTLADLNIPPAQQAQGILPQGGSIATPQMAQATMAGGEQSI